MKISDVLTEAVPVSAPSNVGRDYINMLNFVKGSGLEGVPADQQVAVALFKELQKQQQKNTKLGQELSAAEKRIDQATASGDMYGQELATHQAELDRERGEIDKQREKMGQIDQQYADRAQASEQQMRSLTDKLEQLKTKPGVDQSTAETLQNQIEKLQKEGIGQDKYKELQKNIETIQGMQQVDDRVIQDLVAQIKSAESAAASAVQTKQELSQDLEKQLAHFKDVEQTVAALKGEVDKLEADAKQNDQVIADFASSIKNIRDQMRQGMDARKASNDDPTLPAKAAQMVTPKPPPPKPQRSLWQPDPRVLAQKLVDKGVLQSVDESQMHKAIAWATGRTK
jgi:DNA repair exonuclease SbcCD ATPase subunit